MEAMEVLNKIVDSFNFVKQSKEYNICIWQCPQLMFLVMGVIIIASLLLVNFLAQKFVEPFVVAIIVLAVAAILLVINYIIVKSFDRIARASKQKSEFVSIMSHRLRSPLSAIKWQTDLLLKKDEILDEERSGMCIAEIRKQNEKMIKIVNDLLDLNKIEDGNLVLNPSKFSFKEAVDEAVQSQRESAAQSNIDIFVSAPDSLPDAFADRQKIKDILFHLLDNAIRYSDGGGKITVSIEKTGDCLKCSVSDEGAGIFDSEEEKVFTKFFRNPENFYHTEGSGIGLYITKSIVELSGGRAGFKSIEGRGSTFWFTLPIGKA